MPKLSLLLLCSVAVQLGLAQPSYYGDFLEVQRKQSAANIWHVTFQQQYQGIDVLDAVQIRMYAENPTVKSVPFAQIDQSKNIANLLQKNHSLDSSLVQNWKQKIQSNYTFTIRFLYQPVWYENKEKIWHAAWKISYGSLDNRLPAQMLILDEQGNELEKRDVVYQHTAPPPDSLVAVKVFLPDPLTTAQVNYGTPYIDSNDTDIPVLNAERIDTNLKMHFENDTFYLKNDYCQIVEFDPPIYPICNGITPHFEYTRSHHCFEQVNVLFHITQFQKYVQSLGFTNLANYPIQADAHGLGGVDASSYSTFLDLLAFGEGGVDDAEDADVIIHEYMHAITHSAAPGSNAGIERRAIEEGNCDYVAASYSKVISDFAWQRVYSWDGNNEFWNGRTVVTPKIYPTDLSGNIYEDGEIWSSTLLQIEQAIGRNTTHRLLLQSLYNYFPQMTMPQAARLLLQADSLLFNKAHSTTIFDAFLQRGILDVVVKLPQTAMPIIAFIQNTAAFARGESILLQNITEHEANWQLCNLQGQVLQSGTLLQSTYINSQHLAAGTYLLQINQPHRKQVAVLLRF